MSERQFKAYPIETFLSVDLGNLIKVASGIALFYFQKLLISSEFFTAWSKTIASPYKVWLKEKAMI